MKGQKATYLQSNHLLYQNNTDFSMEGTVTLKYKLKVRKYKTKLTKNAKINV